MGFERIESLNETATDQVAKLLSLFDKKTLSASEMMQKIGLLHKPTFRNNYLHPAMDQGYIEMTIPDKPNSRFQKYRMSPQGVAYLKKH